MHVDRGKSAARNVFDRREVPTDRPANHGRYIARSPWDPIIAENEAFTLPAKLIMTAAVTRLRCAEPRRISELRAGGRGPGRGMGCRHTQRDAPKIASTVSALGIVHMAP
jgi:hypothetical protein